MRLKDKVCIVTGSSRGIGFAIAKVFIKEGAKVVICGSTDITVQRALEEVRKEYKDAEVLGAAVDVTNQRQVNDMVKAALDKWGRIDVLVNNAGITSSAPLIEQDEAEFNKTMEVNVNGTFYCAKAVAKIMVEQKHGNIINTSSVIGLCGGVNQTAYAASKWAVIGLTKSWAKELGRMGIRVNAVAPGSIDTDMTKVLSEDTMNMLIAMTPLQAIGNAEDLAYAYVYLASDEAKFVNGAILSVDGGIVF